MFSGERPYACKHCDKTFVRKEHLIRHSISHAGTKQFDCEQCGKSFSRKDNLHKHRKTHSGEGPYICHTCGKNFVVKHYFLMHLVNICQSSLWFSTFLNLEFTLSYFFQNFP
ncbi:hypothetical protein ONE63_001447 [Megalurothrips usitatus]|uniref:C2H2-type domain-containing protein n=1 Tax=Megalurothrips usitatus TaxID=439358 RepID=A0AAV7XGJ0_9NEOP|nr:hypothetical protein ONE63_001447 [Megalurothrips usitatus]